MLYFACISNFIPGEFIHDLNIMLHILRIVIFSQLSENCFFALNMQSYLSILAAYLHYNR